ncbi:hypothetical protein [Devosia aurantiaca]|uniref:Uncharacterized protein n=1 Tax=Devosia aurantiaca TaxID=2714858 RepID=A0A6M1SRV5_9HYPH|nr:hypothetical protein [Devosia aurantiaca]NGP19286.1 hypothetical protein [Devosia aurantiaca]
MTDLLDHYAKAAKLLAEARQCRELMVSNEGAALEKLSEILNMASSATFEMPFTVMKIYEPVFGLVLAVLSPDDR